MLRLVDLIWIALAVTALSSPAAAQTWCRPGNHLNVSWHGGWYPATAKRPAQGGCVISYDEFSGSPDETVGSDRAAPAGSKITFVNGGVEHSEPAQHLTVAVAQAESSDWPVKAARSSRNWLIGRWRMVETQCVHPQNWQTREVYTPTQWALFEPPSGYNPGWTTHKIFSYNVNPKYAWVMIGPSASETGKIYYVDPNHIKEENKIGPTCVFERVN